MQNAVYVCARIYVVLYKTKMFRASPIFNQPFAALAAQNYKDYVNSYQLSLQSTLEKEKNIRSGVDRRNRSGFNLKMLTGDGNRKAIRRQEDQGRIFIVDQYSPVLFMVVVGILFLCVIDAILTLILLNHGAHETNPVMAYLLNISPYAFIIPKYSITVIGTFGLFMFRAVVIRKLNVRTHSLLSLIVCVYLAVVAWELYLIYYVI